MKRQAARRASVFLPVRATTRPGCLLLSYAPGQAHFDRDVQAQLSFFFEQPSASSAHCLVHAMPSTITPSSRRLTDNLGAANLGAQT